MIRGLAILGVGAALGYSKAVSNVPEVKEFFTVLKDDFQKFQLVVKDSTTKEGET